MYPLSCPIMKYDWGSPTAIPEALEFPSDGSPVAEIWAGAHPSHPSAIPDGTGLDALIASDPEGTLGQRISTEELHRETVGTHPDAQGDAPQARLPFLVKMIAPSHSLSLQVHPNREQARHGFAQETASGPGIYVDAEHKPEMLLAISSFDLLVGFVDHAEAARRLRPLAEVLPHTITDATTVRGLFTALVLDPGLDDDHLRALVKRCQKLTKKDRPIGPYNTVTLLANQFPGDRAALAALLMWRMVLPPGQSLSVPAGTVHAYLGGLGMEIMANSDNVLRAGLTSKPVNPKAFLECASFDPARPTVSSGVGNGTGIVRHDGPDNEFALLCASLPSIGAPQSWNSVPLNASGPRVVWCLKGKVTVSSNSDTKVLEIGDVVFVPAREGGLILEGEGDIVVAYCPEVA